jgi:hypothetical protein
VRTPDINKGDFDFDNIDPEVIKKRGEEMSGILMAAVECFHKTALEEEKRGEKPKYSSSKIFNVLMTMRMFKDVDMGGAFRSSIKHVKDSRDNRKV